MIKSVEFIIDNLYVHCVYDAIYVLLLVVDKVIWHWYEHGQVSNYVNLLNRLGRFVRLRLI